MNAIFYFFAKTIQNSDELKVVWDKVKPWCERTMELCRLGKLEESYDCRMYQRDGVDQNGLDLYIRLRGSN